MLGAFGRALVEAINGSSEISGAARRLRREGYSLHLVLGCLQEGQTEGAEEPAAPPGNPARKPAFRLDGKDVTFLKSIGIDPTRSIRRRRKPGPAS
ncbi:MAG TPA: hypothetical protein VGG06_10945 [Thermoanaerobaculia bacterium]|jgi:hypothetical protein